MFKFCTFQLTYTQRKLVFQTPDNFSRNKLSLGGLLKQEEKFNIMHWKTYSDKWRNMANQNNNLQGPHNGTKASIAFYQVSIQAFLPLIITQIHHGYVICLYFTRWVSFCFKIVQFDIDRYHFHISKEPKDNLYYAHTQV